MDILLLKSLPSCDRLLTKPTSVAISLENISYPSRRTHNDSSQIISTSLVNPIFEYSCGANSGGLQRINFTSEHARYVDSL